MVTCLKCNKPVERVLSYDDVLNIEKYIIYVECHGQVDKFVFLRGIPSSELKYAFGEEIK